MSAHPIHYLPSSSHPPTPTSLLSLHLTPSFLLRLAYHHLSPPTIPTTSKVLIISGTDRTTLHKQLVEENDGFWSAEGGKGGIGGKMDRVEIRFCTSLPEVAFLLGCLSCEGEDNGKGKGKADEATDGHNEAPPFPLFVGPPVAVILYNTIGLLPPSPTLSHLTYLLSLSLSAYQYLSTFILPTSPLPGIALYLLDNANPDKVLPLVEGGGAVFGISGGREGTVRQVAEWFFRRRGEIQEVTPDPPDSPDFAPPDEEEDEPPPRTRELVLTITDASLDTGPLTEDLVGGGKPQEKTIRYTIKEDDMSELALRYGRRVRWVTAQGNPGDDKVGGAT